jgi:hypothetical protein
MLRLVMAILCSIWSKGIITRIILMRIEKLLGRSSKTSMNLNLPLASSKLDKEFIDSSLKKDQDLEVCIIELENFYFSLDDITSSMSENQVTNDVLNNLPTDDNLQLALLEKI